MFDGAFGESIAFLEVEIDRVGGGTDGKNGVGVAPGEALRFGTATGGEAEEECHFIILKIPTGRFGVATGFFWNVLKNVEFFNSHYVLYFILVTKAIQIIWYFFIRAFTKRLDNISKDENYNVVSEDQSNVGYEY